MWHLDTVDHYSALQRRKAYHLQTHGLTLRVSYQVKLSDIEVLLYSRSRKQKSVYQGLGVEGGETAVQVVCSYSDSRGMGLEIAVEHDA